MECARYHVEAKKGNKDVSKINSVRKNKGVCLPHEVLGECGAKPTNCGRNELASKENSKRISDLKGDMISEDSYKTWNKFVAWLRLKKVKIMQDFKEEFQWKWQCNGKEDVLH